MPTWDLMEEETSSADAEKSSPSRHFLGALESFTTSLGSGWLWSTPRTMLKQPARPNYGLSDFYAGISEGKCDPPAASRSTQGLSLLLVTLIPLFP